MDSASDSEARAKASPADSGLAQGSARPGAGPIDTKSRVTTPRGDAAQSAGGVKPAEPTSGIRYAYSSLKNRDFLYLWLGMLCLMGGMQMQMIARGYLVYDITSRPILLGIVNAGAAIPILVLALFGGAIADRVDRKRIVQGGQALNMVLVLTVAVLITTGTVTWIHLLAASMIQGAMWSFMMPARQAIIPEIVGQQNLTNGLALNAAGMSATTLLAPAIGGTLYAALGPDGVYYVITALSFMAIVFTTMVRYEGSGPARPDVAMMGDIKEGLAHIWGNPMVLLLLAMALSTTLLTMPFRFLIPIFVVEMYERGPEALGLLVSMMGLGSLVGAMFIASLGKWKRGLLLILGSFMSGIGLLMVAIFPFYLAAAGIMVIVGLGDAARRTLNQTLIMEVVEDRYRGRVMGVFMMNFGLMPLGVLPAAFAIEALGSEMVIALLGISVLVVTTLILVTQRRLREFE